MMGMLGQLTMGCLLEGKVFYNSNILVSCFVRLIWRFFGMSSGCVAFVMAIERYFALTKPFVYCQHFTNGLIKRLILITWTSCAALTFAPVFGFGIFCDYHAKKCSRYRDATEPVDIAYAFLFFLVGEFALILIFLLIAGNFITAGTLLCIFMILCNCSVTRIVYRSYHNMHQLTMSCMENNNVAKENRKPETILRHQLSEVSSSSNTSKSMSLITRDELKFIKMCNLLTASFVLCWGCQMVSKLFFRGFLLGWVLVK
jgi:prostaglandin E receptor 4